MKIKTIVVGPIETNCYLAYDEGTRLGFLVDPGDGPGKILGAVSELRVKISHIFLTHGHFDHIGALAAVRHATGAAVAIHEKDAARLGTPPGPMFGGFPRFGSFTPVRPDLLLSDSQEVEADGVTLRVLHTPGHTPGSVCLDTGDVLFSGDTLFEGDCGRCDLPGGDVRQMTESLRRLYALPGDRLVLPGHGPSTTLSRERRTNADMLRAVRT